MTVLRMSYQEEPDLRQFLLPVLEDFEVPHS